VVESGVSSMWGIYNGRWIGEGGVYGQSAEEIIDLRKEKK
jgi:hypothetical protein